MVVDKTSCANLMDVLYVDGVRELILDNVDKAALKMLRKTSKSTKDAVDRL